MLLGLSFYFLILNDCSFEFYNRNHDNIAIYDGKNESFQRETYEQEVTLCINTNLIHFYMISK